MGFFDSIFGKKEKSAERVASFVFGVQGTFNLQNSTDLVVLGRVKGTVRPGDAAYIHGWSDEDDSITLVPIKRLEINHQAVNEATDCLVALMLENAAGAGIKAGSVIATRDISEKDVHSAYINAIGDYYVGMKHLELSDEELAQMSITDMAEAWRLYLYANRQSSNPPLDDTDTQRQKMDRLGKKMVEKILAQKEISLVYSTLTKEPFLFSSTIDNHDGTYQCTPPEVMMITKPYLNAYKDNYSKNGFEIRTISNNEDGKGIYHSLAEAFYLNGACALRVNGREVGIVSSEVVPAPTYEGVPEISIPITNPDLMRWQLLMGQLGEPGKEDDSELIYGLYYNFFLRELAKAKFLIPMQNDIPIQPNEKGETVIKEHTTLKFPTLPGKEDRDAVRMYTDWRMLRKCFDEKWDAMIQPISGMIEVFDCAVNVTDTPAVGSYINRKTYDEAAKRQ